MDKNDIARLDAAIARWDRHRQEIADLSEDRMPDWRKKTVDYRRLLQADIAEIGSLVAGLAVATDAERDLKALRSALSGVRSRTAAHQANWPVVAIVPDDPQYRESVRALRAANKDFATTSRALLARLATNR